MRFFLILVFMISAASAAGTASRIDRLLQVQDSVFSSKHQGIKMFWQMDKKALTKIDDRLEKRLELPMPPPPPPPPADTTHAITTSHDNTDRIIALSERVAVLETNVNRLVTVAEGSQKMNIDNRKFILDLINSILAFLGSGGVLSLLVTIYFKTRKKKA